MKRKGFTLVELLVVIAIIAVLLSILVPTLRKAREITRAIVCASNVKQLVLGLTMYEQVHETFPCQQQLWTGGGTPPGGWAIGSNNGMVYWFQLASIELGKGSAWKNLYKCPSNHIQLPVELQKSAIMFGNYGVNDNVCRSQPLDPTSVTEFYSKPLSMRRIPHPSETLLVVDSSSINARWRETSLRWALTTGEVQGWYYLPGMPCNEHPRIVIRLKPQVVDDAIKGRHCNKQVNVGFVAGHVKRVRSSELRADPDEDKSWRNRIPLWLPSKDVAVY
ncbi:MAG: type II secretion system protein [Planctomycetota bacterium]